MHIPCWLNHGKYCVPFLHHSWTWLMVVVVIHHCCERELLGEVPCAQILTALKCFLLFLSLSPVCWNGNKQTKYPFLRYVAFTVSHGIVLISFQFKWHCFDFLTLISSHYLFTFPCDYEWAKARPFLFSVTNHNVVFCTETQLLFKLHDVMVRNMAAHITKAGKLLLPL